MKNKRYLLLIISLSFFNLFAMDTPDKSTFDDDKDWLERGCRNNDINEYKSIAGNIDIQKLSRENKKNFEEILKIFSSVILNAKAKGNDEIACFMIEKQRFPKHYAFVKFIEESNFECAQWLLDKKYVNINEKWCTINRIEGFKSPTSDNSVLHLFSSVSGTSFDQISFLIKNGADPNLINSHGFTPATYAFFAENYGIYYLLTNKEFDLQKQLISNLNTTQLTHTECQNIESYICSGYAYTVNEEEKIKALIKSLSKDYLGIIDTHGNNILHRILINLIAQQPNYYSPLIVDLLPNKIRIDTVNDQDLTPVDLALRYNADLAKRIVMETKQRFLTFRNLMTVFEKNDLPLLYTILVADKQKAWPRGGYGDLFLKKDTKGNTIFHLICQKKFQPEFLKFFETFLDSVLFEPNKQGQCPFELILENYSQHVIEFIFKNIDLSSIDDVKISNMFPVFLQRICKNPNLLRIFVKQFINQKFKNSGTFFQYILYLIVKKVLPLETFDEIMIQAKNCELNLDVNFCCMGRDSVLPTLHFAAREGYADYIKKLLSHGANPSITNPDNITALQIAARFGYSDCVKILLDNGADPFGKNCKGKTPIDLATGDALSVLLPYYPKLLEEQHGQMLILQNAIKTGNKRKVEELLELMENKKQPELIFSKNEDGLTLFELALKECMYEIAHLLFKFNKNYIGRVFIPREKSNTLYRCLRDENRQQLILGSNTSGPAFEVYKNYLDRLKRELQIFVAKAIKSSNIYLLRKMVLQIPFCFTFFDESYLKKVTDYQFKVNPDKVNLIKEAFGLSPLGLSLYYLKHNDKDQLRVIPFLLSLSPKLLRYQDILKAATEGTLGVFQKILAAIEIVKIRESCLNLGISGSNIKGLGKLLGKMIPPMASYDAKRKAEDVEELFEGQQLKRKKEEQPTMLSKEAISSNLIESNVNSCKELDDSVPRFFDHQKFLVKVNEIFDSPEHIPHINRREIPFLKLINSKGNTVLHQLILKYDIETLKNNEKLLRTLLKVIDSVLIEEPRLANIKNHKNQTSIELADYLSLGEISQSMKFRLNVMEFHEV